jgi:hypothetical protein
MLKPSRQTEGIKQSSLRVSYGFEKWLTKQSTDGPEIENPKQVCM